MGLNALQGVRVLDLSHVIAGPTASHYLALEGAEVIKIEKTGKGDILRRSGQALAPGISVGFAAINLGKKSLALDLKTPEGKDVLRKIFGQGLSPAWALTTKPCAPSIPRSSTRPYRALARKAPGARGPLMTTWCNRP
jgi:hypothetical protein